MGKQKQAVMNWTVIQPPDRKLAFPVISRSAAEVQPVKWGGDVIGQIGRRWTRTAVLWCRVMHDNVTWPLHGSYQCRHCHRTYVAPWD